MFTLRVTAHDKVRHLERVKYGKVRHETQQTPALGGHELAFYEQVLEFGWLCRPLWIRRVLVDPNRSPSARAQEGLIYLQCAVAVCQRLVAECPPHISRPLAKFFVIRFSGDDVLPWACSHAEER
jgi:hypothetical protein